MYGYFHKDRPAYPSLELIPSTSAIDETNMLGLLYQSMSMVEKEAGPDYSSGAKSSKSKTLAKTSKSKSKKNTLSPTTKAPTTTSPTTKAPTTTSPTTKAPTTASPTVSPTTSPTTSSTCKDLHEACTVSSECCEGYGIPSSQLQVCKKLVAEFERLLLYCDVCIVTLYC